MAFLSFSTKVIGKSLEEISWDWSRRWGESKMGRLNYAQIVIPKKNNSTEIIDFRPISLLNCSIKIMSKVLANRLVTRLHELVDPCQTWFRKGRNIVDGIVITQEVIYQVKKEKIKGFLLKLDFEKAYERVNWDSIMETFVTRKFGASWCGWIRNWLFHRRLGLSVVRGGERNKMLKRTQTWWSVIPFSFYASSKRANSYNT